MATRQNAASGPLTANITQTPAEPIPTGLDFEDDDGSDFDFLTNDDNDLAPSTISLSESVTQYRCIQGRTYTQKTEYWGPNDAKQNDALEMNHHWQMLFLDNKLFLAPIGDYPQKVLDIGTGTGTWAIDFADEFPSAQVTGLDISPIQPSWLPPNCKFQIDDIERIWDWPDDHFDFIHARHLEGCVSDWPHLYAQAFKHLKPGGYFEIKEFDIEAHSQTQGAKLDENHIYKRWARAMFEALEKIGKPGTQTRNHGIADALGAAGFVNIIEHKWPIPIGGWSSDPKLKEVGVFNLYYLDQSLEGFAVLLLKEVMGWDESEISSFIEEMRRAIKIRKLAPYFTLHLVYAQKPKPSG